MEDAPQRSSPHGAMLLRWEVDEYPRYERGLFWYVGAAIVGMGLLWYALATVNFLFALIIIIFAIVMLLGATREPQRIAVALTEDGLELGTRFYPWKDFESFWVAYEPPMVKSLYLDFKSSFHPPFGVSLEDMNPNAVRDVLLVNVRENLERENEPTSDAIGRMLKI